jgi:hypothetical protein
MELNPEALRRLFFALKEASDRMCGRANIPLFAEFDFSSKRGVLSRGHERAKHRPLRRFLQFWKSVLGLLACLRDNGSSSPLGFFARNSIPSEPFSVHSTEIRPFCRSISFIGRAMSSA